MQDLKHHRERKRVVYGAAGIMAAITLLSCVSSFLIYREGFQDVPYAFQQLLALFAVIVVEGAFVWLLYGYTRAFSSTLERVIAFCGLVFITAVMLTNLATHFMMAKNVELHRYQVAWCQWAAVCVFIAVLVLVLAITMADPIARLTRLELRYAGRQHETIIEAKEEALDSDRIRTAMTNRADAEADKLARQIEGENFFPRQSGPAHQSHSVMTSNWGPQPRARRANGQAQD